MDLFTTGVFVILLWSDLCPQEENLGGRHVCMDCLHRPKIETHGGMDRLLKIHSQSDHNALIPFHQHPLIALFCGSKSMMYVSG